jgi:hypothetical protein
MAIKSLDKVIMSDDGKLLNSPSLTITNPSGAVLEVTTPERPLPIAEGFTLGGQNFSIGGFSTIEKFPLAISGGTGTSAGNLSRVKLRVGGVSDFANGVGFGLAGQQVPGTTMTNDVDKFTVASGGQALDVANTIITQYNVATAQATTDGFGFGAGSYDNNLILYDNIEKFPFAISGGTTTDVGSLTTAAAGGAGITGPTEGFTGGGGSSYPPFTRRTAIDKYPFAIFSGVATTVANFPTGITTMGFESETDGFTAGGGTPTPQTVIYKFPFAISGGALVTNVGSLNFDNNTGYANVSGGSNGYKAGGGVPSPHTTTIEKFPFAISGGTATEVGDLQIAKTNMGAFEY